MTAQRLVLVGMLSAALVGCADAIFPPLPRPAPTAEVERLLAAHDVTGPASIVEVASSGAIPRLIVGRQMDGRREPATTAIPGVSRTATEQVATGDVSAAGADAPPEQLAFIVNPSGGKYMRDAPHTQGVTFSYFCRILHPDGSVEVQQALDVTVNSIEQTPQANTGGHMTGKHDTSLKPVGTWSPSSGSTEGDGAFETEYSAGIAAGDEVLEHTYTFNDTDCVGLSATDRYLIATRYGGLVPIPEGLFHMYFDGITSDHESVFYTTPAVNTATAFTAILYYITTSAQDSLRVNAASTVYGGINDVFAQWRPPHHSHRIGTDLDLDGHTDSDAVHARVVRAGHRAGFEYCFAEMNKSLGRPDHVHCYHRTY